MALRLSLTYVSLAGGPLPCRPRNQVIPGDDHSDLLPATFSDDGSAAGSSANVTSPRGTGTRCTFLRAPPPPEKAGGAMEAIDDFCWGVGLAYGL